MKIALRSDLQRFILVGVGSNVVNFAAYFILILFGEPLYLSAITGYLVGLFFSYHFGRVWVFGQKFQMSQRNLTKFAAVNIVGGIGMSLLIELADRTMSFDHRLIWLFGAAFALMNNFLGLKWFVFSQVGKYSDN